jgi:cell division protein FtsA
LNHPASHRQSIVAVLDIGTTKIACMIARPDKETGFEVLGIGHQLSKGIKSGVITDIAEANTSIRAALHAAETMAGLTVEDVMVSVNGSHLKSRNVTVDLDILADGVNDRDVLDIIHEGSRSMQTEDTTIVHCFPAYYTIDATRGIRDPRGMVGKKLGAELQVITAKSVYLQNLNKCLAGAHLNVSEYVMSSHASALSVLEPDEMDLGVTLIDMGGGVTSISVFAGGRNIYSDTIPIGGNHVTSDIAQGLSTSVQVAERLKTLYGNAINSVKDTDVLIDVPQLGDSEEDDEPVRMPRAMLVGVIRPRMEEIFEMVRAKLESSGVNKIAGRRCVITGGASQMLGVGDLAERMLAKQVRKGKPHLFPGTAEAIAGPAFASVVGMLHYAQKRPWEEALLTAEHTRRRFIPERLRNWLRENF